MLSEQPLDSLAKRQIAAASLFKEGGPRLGVGLL
jgi:hypothetical protein